MTVMLRIRSSTWSIVEGMTLILLLCDVSCIGFEIGGGAAPEAPAPAVDTVSGRLALLPLQNVGHRRRQAEGRIDRGQELGHGRDERAQDLGQQHFVAR